MPEIQLTDVTRIRAGVEIVRGVSFRVEAGSLCVLLGPSGAGKTALLRLIAGLDQVTAGVIETGDAVHQSWRAGRRDVAELVSAEALAPRRNLYDNMIAGLTALAGSKREAQRRVLLEADALGLGALLARKPGAVSAGERRRAALGRARARQTEILLLDEPLADLDPTLRWRLRREIRRMQREQGATILWATQDHAEAMAVGDQIVLIKDGRVEQVGAPDALYDRPPTKSAAELLGSPPMNLLPVRANQTGLSLEDGTTLGAASVMTNATFAWLGVRPEHLFIPGETGPAAAARLPMTVEAVERAGADLYAHGLVGPHAVTARLPASTPGLSEGGRIVLGAAREHLHLFDAVSGARI
jgi:ABC-type sugar transport system ATPase subunit